MPVTVEDKAGRCDSCIFAMKLTYPPSLGGSTDGVDCMNFDVARFQEENGAEGMLEEYEEHGSVNLWRIEVMSDCKCEYWGALLNSCP